MKVEIQPFISTVTEAVPVIDLPCLKSRFPCSAVFLKILRNSGSFPVLCPLPSCCPCSSNTSVIHTAHGSCNAEVKTPSVESVSTAQQNKHHWGRCCSTSQECRKRTFITEYAVKNEQLSFCGGVC